MATPPPPITTTAPTAPSAIQSVLLLLPLDDSALDPGAEVPPVEPLSSACEPAEAEGEDEAEADDAELANRSPPLSLARGSTFAGPASYSGSLRTSRGRIIP